jgi:hypothetical protein
MTAEVPPEISSEAGNADKLSLADTSVNWLPAVVFHRASSVGRRRRGLVIVMLCAHSLVVDQEFLGLLQYFRTVVQTPGDRTPACGAILLSVRTISVETSRPIGIHIKLLRISRHALYRQSFTASFEVKVTFYSAQKVIRK